MNNELMVNDNLPLTAQQVRGQVNLIQEVMRDVMRLNEHYGTIPGCGPKPTLLQPGAQKLLMTFRLVADPDVTIEDMGNGHREVRCKVKLYNQSGIFLGAGVGTCSTMEGKYRFRSGPVELTDKPVPKEYWDLRGKDPRAAQALLGEGMQAKKNEAGVWVCARKGGQVEHDNPADYYNTVEKMAYKRALVSATLTVTAASDIFTQDIEDMPEVIQPVSQASRAPVSAPQSEDQSKANLSAAQAALKKQREGAAPANPAAASEPGAPPSPGAPSFPEETWQEFLTYLDENPDRRDLKELVKSQWKMKNLKELRTGDRAAFIKAVQAAANANGIKFDVWIP